MAVVFARRGGGRRAWQAWAVAAALAAAAALLHLAWKGWLEHYPIQMVLAVLATVGIPTAATSFLLDRVRMGRRLASVPAMYATALLTFAVTFMAGTVAVDYMLTWWCALPAP